MQQLFFSESTRLAIMQKKNSSATATVWRSDLLLHLLYSFVIKVVEPPFTVGGSGRYFLAVTFLTQIIDLLIF